MCRIKFRSLVGREALIGAPQHRRQIKAETVEAGVVAPLDDLRTALQALMDDAPWLGSPQRSALLDAVAEVRADALDGVAADAFAAAAGIAAELIRTTFGVAA